MGQYNEQLKSSIKQSITTVFKDSLDEVSLFLKFVEATIRMVAPSSARDETVHYLNETYQILRKKILDLSNEEIRKMDRVIDALTVEKKPAFEDIIIFNNKN